MTLLEVGGNFKKIKNQKKRKKIMTGDFDVSDLPNLSEHEVAKILQKQKSKKGSSEYILDSGKTGKNNFEKNFFT